jgi:hypothetical protein
MCVYWFSPLPQVAATSRQSQTHYNMKSAADGDRDVPPHGPCDVAQVEAVAGQLRCPHGVVLLRRKALGRVHREPDMREGVKSKRQRERAGKVRRRGDREGSRVSFKERQRASKASDGRAHRDVTMTRAPQRSSRRATWKPILTRPKGGERAQTETRKRSGVKS